MIEWMNDSKIRWIEAFILLAILWIGLFSKIKEVPFHPDESNVIYRSRYLEILLKFDLSLWEENYWTLTQPKLNSFIIGVGRLVSGFGLETLPCPYNFFENYQTNLLNGCIPNPDLLLAARRPMALLTGLSLLGSYLLITKACNRLGGLAFLLFMFVNPQVRIIFLRAKGEAALFFFVVVTMLLMNKGLLAWQNCCNTTRTNSRRDAYFYFAATGMSMGMAGSIRLNGILLGFSVYFLFMIALFLLPNKFSCQQKKKYAIRVLFLFFICGLMILIILNPYLYPSPLINLGRMLKFRSIEMQLQMLGWPDTIVPSGLARWTYVASKIFYDLSISQSISYIILQVVLTLAGLYFCVKNTITWSKGFSQKNSVFAIVLILPLPLVIAGIFSPLDYNRYYIFAKIYQLMLSSITIGISSWKVLDAVKSLFLMVTNS